MLGVKEKESSNYRLSFILITVLYNNYCELGRTDAMPFERQKNINVN